MEPLNGQNEREDSFEPRLGTSIVPSKEFLRSRGTQVSSNISIETTANSTDAVGGTLPVSSGGTGANTLTGILKGNGTSAITTVSGLAGTKQYYVADSSGGAVTRRLTFQDGILVSES